MGLAASQARFLGITARKANCEFQSMQIAEQKLSVTRDLERAARDYQNSLGATKLVWDTTDQDVYDLSYDVMMTPSTLNEFDPYLVTDTRGRIVLTQDMFDAAEKAGIIEADGTPTGKTFRKGSGDNPGKIDGSRDAFLYQLGQKNLIDGTTADKITELGDLGYTKSGIGGKIFNKTSANALTTYDFMNYMKNITWGDVITNENYKSLSKGTIIEYDYIYDSEGKVKQSGTTKYEKGNALQEDINVLVYQYNQGDTIDKGFEYELKNYKVASDSDTNTITFKGTKYTKQDGQNVTLKFSVGDIAPVNMSVAFETSQNSVVQHKKDDYVYGVNFDDITAHKDQNGNITSHQLATSEKDITNDKFLITKDGQYVSETTLNKLTIGDILTGKYEITYKQSSSDNANKYIEKFQTILKALAQTLGYDTQGPKGLNVDVESDKALSTAYDLTSVLLNKLSTKDSKKINTLVKQAQSQNDVVKGATYKNGSSDSDGTLYTISLTNLMKSYLTYFAICIDGFTGSDFNIQYDSSKTSNYVTSDPNYYFLLKKEDSMTDQTMLYADFYNMLYNQIATQGACTDKIIQENVTDNNWLQNQIKNGHLFISSLNNDGYFYQGAYTLNGHVAEVPDENAITQAELEYNITKSKLNYKEETLELQMKNIDMEIASLSTEFDTVKNLISKNVEKVFTMFST